MSTNAETEAIEMAKAEFLPQLDATSLVDADQLEGQIIQMYRHVAREEAAELHFEVGGTLAEQLGYPAALLRQLPAEAVASFAGVGYHLDLAAIDVGDHVLDLGSGSGTDVFAAAVRATGAGRVVGADITDEQLHKATRLRNRGGFANVEFVATRIEELPFDDATFDVVISNGVVNLSLRKDAVFAEAARVLRPGGRLAISDIVSARPLKERTRRNADLWAACIAGAVPRERYLDAITAPDLEVRQVRANNYRFISHRALAAAATYGVQSISVLAEKAR